MSTQAIKKLNRLEKEMKVLKSFVSNLVPYDNEGEYRSSFLNQIKKASSNKSNKSVFTYTGKGSLLKKLN
jgi:hypothetical protein